MQLQPFGIDLTTFLAIYGAVISTLLFVRHIIVFIKDSRKDKRQVRILCNPGFVSIPPAFLGQEATLIDLITITAVNVGHRPIELKYAGLNLNDGRRYTQLETEVGAFPLPKILGDGESIEIHFELERMTKALNEKGNGSFYTSAYVQDAEGNIFKTNLPRLMHDTGLAKKQRWHNKFFRR